MKVLVVYKAVLEDGTSDYGSDTVLMHTYPPTISDVRHIENMLKAEYDYKDVLVVNWLPLSDDITSDRLTM